MKLSKDINVENEVSNNLNSIIYEDIHQNKHEIVLSDNVDDLVNEIHACWDDEKSVWDEI